MYDNATLPGEPQLAGRSVEHPSFKYDLDNLERAQLRALGQLISTFAEGPPAELFRCAAVYCRAGTDNLTRRSLPERAARRAEVVHPKKKKKEPAMSEPSQLSKTFANAASATAHAAGKPITFVACCLVIVLWAVSGPLFHFSDTWQLIINTGTTIVTFLMVFLIQNTQNRDGTAIQAKLDELILVGSAPNRYIGIEALTDEELEELREKCRQRANKKAGPSS